ncbi:hypothetical protein E4T44_01500, partial [Aureobasidium sp. EXF-8845]
GTFLKVIEQETLKDTPNNDILDLLLKSKGPDGLPMRYDKLVSEALTQLIAGSDTVSNTSCAIIHWILAGERANTRSSQKSAVLEEMHRRSYTSNSTSALGLPRLVTSTSGVWFEGIHFPMGTVLSVPSYTLHHDPFIWGDDMEVLNPNRFLLENFTQRQRLAFNPFSHGPRACVGQNVAMMELQLIVGTLSRRY